MPIVNEIFKAVEIEINHGCNMACAYCPNSVASRIEKGQMQPEVYERIIAQLESLNFSGRLSFDFYNEPTLSPQLKSFISLARQKLPKTSIELYSNGTLLTAELYRDLITAGVSQFIITKHDKVDDYVFDKTLSVLNDDEKKLLTYRSFIEINLTNRGGVLTGVGNEKTTAFMPCHLPDQMLTVTVKGNIVPCFEDFYQKNQMGNIMENSLMDIWNSEKYQEFRTSLRKGLRHKYDACKNCNRLEVL